MKRIILFLIVLLLAFTGCKKRCEIDKPKDLQPIDWENYNDVYTVYHNLSASDKLDDMPVGKKIKVAGWIRTNEHISADKFSIRTDSINTGDHSSIQIIGTAISEDLQIKFDTCDLSKKCFIKGKIVLQGAKTMYCTTYYGIIIIENIEDIYFDGERSEK
jgi:hypothetical protein